MHNQKLSKAGGINCLVILTKEEKMKSVFGKLIRWTVLEIWPHRFKGNCIVVLSGFVNSPLTTFCAVV